eukprot:6389412-Prymnesium_polylepis.1
MTLTDEESRVRYMISLLLPTVVPMLPTAPVASPAGAPNAGGFKWNSVGAGMFNPANLGGGYGYGRGATAQPPAHAAGPGSATGLTPAAAKKKAAKKKKAKKVVESPPESESEEEEEEQFYGVGDDGKMGECHYCK